MDNQQYEVSFILKQTGIDGEIEAYLDFSHPPGAFDNQVPTSFEYMLSLAQMYLEMSGFVDENGNIRSDKDQAIDDGAFVHVASPSTRLN